MGITGETVVRAAGLFGMRRTVVSVDAGALAAVSAVNVDVVVALGFDVRTTDSVVVLTMPSGLDLHVVLQGLSIPAVNTIRFRFVNHSAAAAVAGAQNYEIGVVRS